MLRKEILRLSEDLETSALRDVVFNERLARLDKDVAGVLANRDDARLNLRDRVCLRRLMRCWQRAWPSFEVARLDSENRKADVLRNGLLRTMRAEISDLRHIIALVRAGKGALSAYKVFLGQTAAHIELAA